MTTDSLPGVTVSTRANVYFDGKCVSHSLTCSDGTRKSVGVVLASELTFKTAAAEVMECVAGGCEYRLAGDSTWRRSAPGERFAIAADSSFDLRVAEAYHYICHFA